MKITALLLVALAIACRSGQTTSASGGSFTPLSQPLARAPECAPGGGDTVATNVYFEFQVGRTAVVNTAGGRPDGRGRGEVVVNFIVDTSGVVLDSTVKAVYPQDRERVPAARTMASRLQFTPAELHSCRVRQLVQQPVATR